MKRLAICCVVLVLAACGYHLGGMKNRALDGMNTFCVNMFANETLYPYVAMQMTTALTDQMQRDGAFRLAQPSSADFVVDGAVRSVKETSLRTDSSNTYLSTEIGLTVFVSYKVTDCRTGRVLVERSVTAQGSYFNDAGNMQSMRDAALSYATRKAAESIVLELTMP